MRRYYLVMAILSAAVLATEIALTRIFAYLIWYHAVFLIISMALLGFAASGSLLTLGGDFFQKRVDQWIRIGSFLFAFLLLLGIFLPVFVPLESEEVTLQGLQHLRNLAIYFIYWGITFMTAGMALALILQRERERVHQVYFASMAGSGIGCLLALVLLYFGPVFTLSAMALLALCATLVVPLKAPFILKGAAVAMIVFVLLVASGVIEPEWQVAPSKKEFHRLARGIIEEVRWSPISVVQVFDTPDFPYGEQGLASHCRVWLPHQKNIIIDAYARSAFTDWHDGDMRRLDFFRFASTSAAFALLQRPQVLVIGIGGGIDVLRALYFNAQSVVGVELNGVLIDLLRGRYREFTGDLAYHPRVKLVKDEGRSYVKHSSEKFDVIQINYTDTWSASSLGALSLAENFLYTSEAIQDYYYRLSNDGILSITRTLARPYRETLRLVLTAMKALKEMGIPEPKRHMLAVASVRPPHMSATLLISKQPFITEKVEYLINVGRGKWLTLFRPDNEPLPPVTRSDAPLNNQYYQWVKEEMDAARAAYASFMANFPDDTSVMDAYEYDVSPLTDNRPFYYFYCRWGSVWDHLKHGRDGELAARFSGVGGGVFLLMVLFLALAGSIVGIFVPLGVWKWRTRKGRSTSVGYRGWYALYFAGLGFGYILVELNLIQKFSLFLGHPVYALSVTLAGLLIFSGIGSYLSRCISWQPRSILTIFFFIILSIVVVMALPKLLFQILAGSQVWIRALSTLVVIGPLGILMGMPFPLCLKQVGRDKPQLIPWLWGVNGFTSVIGSVLATIIAVTYGYSAVTVTASSAYIIALIAGVLLSRKGASEAFPG